jgi:hypothetical protein
MYVLIGLLAASLLNGQTPDALSAVLARLGKEADLFERSAHRVIGIETLRQTVPDGVRTGRGPRGILTRLPGFTREIISEYGFVSLDEPGGSLREIRQVLKVDGLAWSKPGRGLASLADQITASDRKGKQRLLERFEEHGLHGFATDFGQLILLFARGGASRYEIRFDSADMTDPSTLWIYTFQQLDGPQALTIYGEGNEPLRQKLQGKLWFRSTDKAPVRISLDTSRLDANVQIRDTAMVTYAISDFGFLLPEKVLHQQFAGRQLLVTDEYTYSQFKLVIPGGRR